VGTIGWVQDFISPLAILGFPFSTQIFGRSKQLLFVAGAATLLLFFGFMLARLRPRATIGQTFYVVAALSSVLYFAYFFLVGPSYQQWKLAGCLPLTMSFAIVAAVIEVILLASDRLASRKSWYQMPAGLISFAACISLVLGNMAIYHVSEPSPPRFSSNYARLRTLENLTGVQSIFIYMESFSTTFFPVYFVRNQLLRLISPSYYSRETLHLKDISPRTPLFFEGDVCEADQYHLPLSGVGCLYFRRPTLTPDHSYQFKQTLPEIADVRGLSVREPWGRWSGAKKVALSMYANQEDIDKLPDGYINFDLSAFLPPGIPTQHVSLSWGKGRQGNLALSERGWISLPVSDQDWVTGDLRKLLIEFDLPDAISPQQVEVTNLDTRTLAIGFIAISWTVHSVGNVPGA
jgi:hypothetical protein